MYRIPRSLITIVLALSGVVLLISNSLSLKFELWSGNLSAILLVVGCILTVTSIIVWPTETPTETPKE